MSIEDDIQARKERIEAELKEAERKKQVEERLSNALRKAGLSERSPALIAPPPDLQPIISETVPSLRFSKPKIVRTMPDGVTRARDVQKDEMPDMYSFDVEIYSDGSGKNSTHYFMSIFKNGAISLIYCRSNLTWAEVKRKGVDAAKVREIIVNALATQALEYEKTQALEYEKKKTSAAKDSGGCYIATAVYGSYDCPEVRVLRRFRDFSLKSSVLGRLFISVYYALSPTLVKWFGNKAWFSLPWRKFLDKKVAVLKEAGYSDKEYLD